MRLRASLYLMLAVALTGCGYTNGSNGETPGNCDSAAFERASAMLLHAWRRVCSCFSRLVPLPLPAERTWPMLLFSDQATFLACFDALRGEGGQQHSITPGGAWFPSPLSLFIMPYNEHDALDAAMAHELIHALLDRRYLPVWLEEGLAQTVDWYLDNREWWGRIKDGSYSGERLGVRGALAPLPQTAVRHQS